MAGSPLDVARVRLQQANAPAVSTGALLGQIARREGVRALFKGLSYPLLTGVFQNALVFQSYGLACRALAPPQVRTRAFD